MSNVQQILTQRLDEAVKALQDNLVKNNRVATGRTKNSIKSTVVDNGNQLVGTVTASSVLNIIQSGRKATSGEPTGSSVWFDQLRQWVQARGLPSEAVYPIFKKIHKEGWEGTPDIISAIINDQWIAETNRLIAEEIAREATEKINENIRALNAANNI